MKGLRFFTFLLITILSFPMYAQVANPCTGGFAGIYPCSNTPLVERMSLTDLNGGNGNDIWGWTSPVTNKEYAIVGLSNGTAFVDMDDPENPVLLGNLATQSNNSTWRDIKVKDNYAYIVSEASGHGVQIFNLLQLDTATVVPKTYTNSAHFTLPGAGNAHNIVINEESKYIVPVGNSTGGGLLFYDATNPLSPIYEDSYESGGYSHDAQCFIYKGPDTEHIGKEICIGFNAQFLHIADVTDKGNPVQLHHAAYTGRKYCHQGWVTDDHKYLFLDDELDESNNSHNTRTLIFDITDLDNPTLHYEYFSTFPSIDHNQYVQGSYVYQANYTAGLRVLDISDVANSNITEVAYFDLYTTNNAVGFSGAWSVYPFFKSGNIIINGISGATAGGLFIVNPDLPHSVISKIGNSVDTVCQGDNIVMTLDLVAHDGFSEAMTLACTGVPAGATASFSVNPVPANGATILTISNTDLATAGKYSISLTGTTASAPTQRLSIGTMIKPDPETSLLFQPSEGATLETTTPSFLWSTADDTDNYTIEIAQDNNIVTVLESATINTTNYTSTGLPGDGTYYWRVTTQNDCDTKFSTVQIFKVVNTALPVDLIEFNGRYQNPTVKLNWRTASEVNNKGFEIQRMESDSRENFEAIGWTNSLGNDGGVYNFSDKNVIARTTYLYRLVQKDFDGQTSFSKTISISIPGKHPVFQIAPNPGKNIFNVHYSTTENLNANSNLILTDISGRHLKTWKYPVGVSSFEIDLSEFPVGVYILRLKSSTTDSHLKVVKW